MKLALFATAALALALSACGSDTEATSSAAPSAKPSATAKSSASAKPAPSAAPSASAAADAGGDPCKAHKLAAGGTGTLGDPCKYSGDLLTAKYKGKIEDGGAVFEITNPWSEKVNWLTAAVYYYDKSGKQMTVKVDGADKKNDFLQGIDVDIPGSKTSDVKLGWTKKELPKDVDSVEVQIISFGWDLGEGKGAYFGSTDKYTDLRAKGGAAPAASASAGPAAGPSAHP